MLSPSVTTTAVDLSRLAAPEVLVSIDYETILAEMLADLRARDTTFTALVESDPAFRILEVCAYRVMIERQRGNDQAKRVMVAFAEDADLDHLGALFNVERLTLQDATPTTPVVMEGNADYRRRIVLGPDGFSVAGPEAAYVYHALSAHPDVLDATAISPSPGQVLVSVQSRVGQGQASAEVLTAVRARLNADEVRPLTDHVIVQSASVITYTVAAQIWVFAGPDSAVVLQAAQAALSAYLADCQRLGRDVNRSGMFAALHVSGVQRVVLATPVDDVNVTRTQVAVCTSAVVTIAGVAE
ncbi:baseplate assembly protein [Brevundimonas nasdae]|uniref:baseplate assembly protein n=1 Tax=Brevundimonas nasdae TaxID=172043 RepID=UPI003F68DDA9